MRVIEPKRQPVVPPVRSKKKPVLTFISFGILSLIIIGVCIFLFGGKTEAPAPSSQASDINAVTNKAKKGTLKIFTSQQFRDLYNNFAYPNTQRISDQTPIVGNVAADNHIRKIAESRGYTLRSAPVTDVFEELEPTMLLQQRAAQPWRDMQASAKKENINLSLSAAYRSAEEQKNIFISRLSGAGIAIERISTGQYDKQIIAVLQSTAVPGYSRHHTGYTIDLICENNPAISFVQTVCFKWLSAENYKNAKTFGWIPSYPEGIGMQGPEPEAWEYVWVGTDTLME